MGTPGPSHLKEILKSELTWKTRISILFYFILFLLFSLFLWPHLSCILEVPRLGVKSELQLLAYTTATAMPEPSCVCDLHHSLWKRQILNPLSKARDQTHILTDNNQVLNPLSHNRNPPHFSIFYKAPTIKMLWSWHRDRHTGQWSRNEGPEINSCIHGQLIFFKGTNIIQWGQNSLFTNGTEKTGYLHAKEWSGPLPYGKYKN